MGYMHNFLTEDDLKIQTVKADLETILRAIPSYLDIMLSQTMMLS
jgi:hypothetical protein